MLVVAGEPVFTGTETLSHGKFVIIRPLHFGTPVFEAHARQQGEGGEITLQIGGSVALRIDCGRTQLGPRIA